MAPPKPTLVSARRVFDRRPPLTNPTIGDRLSAKGITWAWYSGGWNAARAGHPDPLFQFNHQPFAYFANYAPGTPGAQHLQDETAFEAAIADGTVAAASFVKPDGQDNEHPGYANLYDGETQTAQLVQQLMRDSACSRSATATPPPPRCSTPSTSSAAGEDILDRPARTA